MGKKLAVTVNGITYANNQKVYARTYHYFTAYEAKEAGFTQGAGFYSCTVTLTVNKARKSYDCEDCMSTIEPGQLHASSVHFHYCLNCVSPAPLPRLYTASPFELRGGRLVER